MPANLTPEYRAAEAEFRRARTPADRLGWLREMLRTIPKHKGTEHLRADIKTRIKELTEELAAPRRGGARTEPVPGWRPTSGPGGGPKDGCVTRPGFWRYQGDEPADSRGTVDLVERARRGDGDAWEELYRRAHPRLLSYASRHLDREAARDAVGETMSRAVSAIGGFRWRGASFDAWLFGILRHVIADARRAAGRTPPVVVEARTPIDPLDALLREEEAAAVRQAFERLGPGDRELLELRVVAGLTADEVAALLGRRPGAIRMAQSRALSRLRHLLDARTGT